MTTLLRNRGLSDLVAGPLETLASGFHFTEGPLWLPSGALLFQDLKASQTWRLDADGSRTLLRDSTHGGNGQTFAPSGRIVFCEQDGRRVSSMAPNGTDVRTAAETLEGRRLNSPNDIIARSDGALFFTDPPYGLPSPEARELPYQAVFRIDRGGRLAPIVHEDFEKPNGLALSPDERTLYVNDTAKYHVRAFRLDIEGAIVEASGHVFATLDPREPGGPDGLKVDRDGRLYIAVAEGIWVFDDQAALLGIIPVPKRPSNLAWGGPNASTLYITAVDAVYRINMRVHGIAPPFQPRT